MAAKGFPAFGHRSGRAAGPRVLQVLAALTLLTSAFVYSNTLYMSLFAGFGLCRMKAQARNLSRLARKSGIGACCNVKAVFITLVDLDGAPPPVGILHFGVCAPRI